MRACNNTGDSPCAANTNNQTRQERGIKKAITDTLASLPNPAQCVGASCGDALLGNTWSKPLLDSFDYYLAYRKRLDGATAITEEAEAFVSTYRKPLSDIYGDQRPEGYFDAE
jgi:hypothetical protein